MQLRSYVGLISLWFSLPVLVLASDVTTFVTTGVTDNTPPTAPSNVRATLIDNRVTVTWDAATDDLAVAGYRVYRNSFLLAEVGTTTTYQDDVSASAQYQYVVTAFDYGPNESDTSASATVRYSRPSGGGRSALGMDMLTTTRSDAGGIGVRFESTTPSTVEVRYGVTGLYELGTIQTTEYSRVHEIILPEETIATVYYLEITLRDRFNRTVTTREVIVHNDDLFVIPSMVPPQVAVDDDRLTFTIDRTGLPWGADVRVVFNATQVPTDVFAGNLIAVTTQSELVVPRQDGYYAFFVVQSDGSVSAGTIVPVGVVTGVGETGERVAGVSFADALEVRQVGSVVVRTADGYQLTSGQPFEVVFSAPSDETPQRVIATVTGDAVSEAQQFTLAWSSEGLFAATIPTTQLTPGVYTITVLVTEQTGTVTQYIERLTVTAVVPTTRIALEAQLRAVLIALITRLQDLLRFRL